MMFSGVSSFPENFSGEFHFHEHPLHHPVHDTLPRQIASLHSGCSQGIGMPLVATKMV